MKLEIRVNGSWLEVSRDIFRSWGGSRRRNGKPYHGPVYYLGSRRRYAKTPLRFIVDEAVRLEQMARTSHPVERPGHLDCAAWYRGEIDRRANAYPLAVEFARFVASQDPNRVTKQGERAYALLRELGEE